MTYRLLKFIYVAVYAASISYLAAQIQVEGFDYKDSDQIFFATITALAIFNVFRYDTKES